MVKHLLVQAGCGLRGASLVIEALRECWGVPWEVPAPTTARTWLLRIAFYQLHRPQEQAADWVWLIDHTVQIGPERCLAVLGIRLCQLPPAGTPLQLENLELLNLLPVEHSDKHVVQQQLEETVSRTGVPRAILSDHGGDLRGGIERFRQDHPETSHLYDVTHKAACLLKRRLEKDARWKSYATRVGQTKFQTQQTELAFLVPPSQRSKARYMNLEPLLRWGQQTLALVEQPPASVLQFCRRERLEEKFGWLREYREALTQWSEYQALLAGAVDVVRRQGYAAHVATQLDQALRPLVRTAAGADLRSELVQFVETQSQCVLPGERLPGSTEILESSFGKLKSLHGEHCKGGLTGMILSLGALVGKLDQATIAKALLEVPWKRVKQWIQNKLGPTHAAKRRWAYHSR
jgi:hypothetical protein